MFLNELSTQIGPVSKGDIFKIANEISYIFTTSAIIIFGLHKNTTLESGMHNNDLFKKDCRTARKDFFS